MYNVSFENTSMYLPINLLYIQTRGQVSHKKFFIDTYRHIINRGIRKTFITISFSFFFFCADVLLKSLSWKNFKQNSLSLVSEGCSFFNVLDYHACSVWTLGQDEVKLYLTASSDLNINFQLTFQYPMHIVLIFA